MTNILNRFIVACIKIYGQIYQRNVGNLLIIHLINTFGQPITSFLSRAVFADYIRGYAEQNNVRQYIQFNTVVRWISYSNDKNKFNVIVKNLKKDETRSEEFDYVIIATGHFSAPNIPHFDGIETFPGRILHAHEFRSAKDFVNKDVLLIGNRLSGEDIGLQL